MADQQLDVPAPAKTPRLLVACLDDTPRRAVEGLAEHAAPALTVIGYDRVEDALAQDAQTPVLVPLTPPLDHLCAALQAGIPPDEALAAWRAEAEALLRACRKARRRVLLLDAAMLTAQPQACAEALGARLGLRFEGIPEPRAAGPAASPMHMVIAATLLANDSKALDLLDELEAMVLGPMSPRSPARVAIASAAENLAGLGEERDLLRENLTQMLGEVEALRTALERSEEETRALEETRGALEGERARAREEAEALRRELAGTAERLAAQEARRGEAETALEEARAALEDAKAQAGKEGARAADLETTLARAEEARAALVEERDLLRENLRQMLEETERLLEETRELEGKLAARDTELADKHLLKAQLDAVHRQLEEARAAHRLRAAVLGAEVLEMAAQEREQRARHAEKTAQLTDDLQAARDEVARLRDSTSWKVTAPLRAARKAVPSL